MAAVELLVHILVLTQQSSFLLSPLGAVWCWKGEQWSAGPALVRAAAGVVMLVDNGRVSHCSRGGVMSPGCTVRYPGIIIILFCNT